MPSRPKLIWLLYPAFVIPALAVLLGFTLLSLNHLEKFYEQRTKSGVEDRLTLLEPQVTELLRGGDHEAMARFCAELGQRTSTRITILAMDGTVLGDSKESPARMDNHFSRPEVQDAFRSPQIGSSKRWSHTLRENYLYVAQVVPTTAGVPAQGVLRIAIPVRDYEQSMRGLRQRIWIIAGLFLLLAAGISLPLARHMTKPLLTMRETARRFATGDLTPRLRIRHSAEMDSLAQDLNQMAVLLDERFRTISRQRQETAAILGGMTEGVVAVDAEARILMLNHAAADMLGVDPERNQGQPLLQAIRNHLLEETVADAMASATPVERELRLDQSGTERVIMVRAAGLEEGGNRRGAVAVLHDVTRLRRLENLRREFVANVSHELRTPITSIRGFVETLQDGALNDPASAHRFLDIIARQSSRLNQIIEDLLQLSRLETDAERSGISFEPCVVQELLQHVSQGASNAARERSIRVTISCEPPALALRANPNLVQQAVANLMDNAIKYGAADSEITIVAARQADGAVRISVRDHGPGIPIEHQQRVFERFHRIDKGRSRELGGTGLGLAIVKHIMQAHGGRVELSSEPGKGATFTLHFPKSPV